MKSTDIAGWGTWGPRVFQKNIHKNALNLYGAQENGCFLKRPAGKLHQTSVGPKKAKIAKIDTSVQKKNISRADGKNFFSYGGIYFLKTVVPWSLINYNLPIEVFLEEKKTPRRWKNTKIVTCRVLIILESNFFEGQKSTPGLWAPYKFINTLHFCIFLKQIYTHIGFNLAHFFYSKNCYLNNVDNPEKCHFVNCKNRHLCVYNDADLGENEKNLVYIIFRCTPIVGIVVVQLEPRKTKFKNLCRKSKKWQFGNIIA
jgi:hypothetical protein